MMNVLAAEWLKARSGRLLLALASGGTLLVLITCAGYAKTAEVELAAGATMADMTAATIRSSFMMLLFSALFGVVLITRECSTGAIGRTVLLSGSRSRIFAAKAIVVTAFGALFGLLAVGLGVASALVMLPFGGHQPQWSRESALTLLGVWIVVTLAAPWGLAIGWLIRSQAAAIATLVVLTLAVDEALFRLLPEVGRFTMGIAMGAVYQDAKPQMLPVWAALLVIFAWLGGAGFAARHRFAGRDVL